MTQQNVYHIEGELFVVDRDVQMKVNDWYIDDTSSIRMAITSDKDYWLRRKDYGKVIATTSPVLSGIDKFDWPGEEEDNIKQLASRWAVDNADTTLATNSALNKGFIAGYKATLKKQYTKEDVDKMMDAVVDIYLKGGGIGSMRNEAMKFLSSMRPIPIYIEFFEGKGEDGKRIVKTVKY